MEQVAAYGIFAAGWALALWVSALGLTRGGDSALKRYAFWVAGFWFGMAAFASARAITPTSNLALTGLLVIWAVLGAGIYRKWSE